MEPFLLFPMLQQSCDSNTERTFASYLCFFAFMGTELSLALMLLPPCLKSDLTLVILNTTDTFWLETLGMILSFFTPKVLIHSIEARRGQ